ncbi:MAG: histidine phosphatase family protein [Fimbriimonas sp.]|nr:histidine phosphatase family protein [Fimbriimonas sp.]
MVLAVAFVVALVGPTDLVFVRHGETVANATGHYNTKTLNAFSEKGQREVDDLTVKLKAEAPFDRILVSPSPRALYTIAPYLRATHRRATVWPLLYECCTGRRPKDAKPTRFTYGGKVKLPSDVVGLFDLMPGEDRYPVSPDYRSGMAQVQASIDEFNRRFASGRVLLVGHSGHGGHFLHALTGKWRKVDNATPIRVSVK